MRHRTRVLSILIALTALAYLACPGWAYIYAGKRKKINCGILYVGGGSQPLSAGLDQYGNTNPSGGVGDLFYLLDQRMDLKPGGWSLENPLAPGSPSFGLTKADPKYWIVDLSSVRSLTRMHVLYLPASGKVNLTEEDREKLREFVDGGGVLWIDNTSSGGSALDFQDTFFILDFKFLESAGVDVPFSRHHPLLTLPFWLTDADVSMLGATYGRNVCEPGYDPNRSTWAGDQPLNFDVLYPVVMNMPSAGSTLRPSVAANHYGSGRIVATSNYVGRGCYLNFPFSTPSYKFAYNVIAWASSWTHLRKDPRHSGNSIDTVGGTKLLETWTLPVPPSSSSESAPVIYKNVAFYSSGSTLFALDIMPQEDLDQDGNPDDGAQGLPGGMPDLGQDIIWLWEGDGNLSSPSLVTAQNPFVPNQSIEAVLVMSSTGVVHMLQAFPVNPANPMQLSPETTEILPGGWSTEAPISNPSPPLYANGWIFAMNGEGRMCAYNPSLEAWMGQQPNPPQVDTKWRVPGQMYQGMADPRYGPLYGFVKNDTSGATVGMLYWFGGPWNAANVQDAERNDHVYGVPVYVSNDRLKVERTDATKVECRTGYRDAYMSENPRPLIQVYSGGVMSVPSMVYPNTRLANILAPGNDRGYVTFEFAGTLSPDAIVYGTYAMDYAKHQIEYQPNTRLRVPLEPRSNSSNSVPETQITGMPAMGPKNMIFLNGKRTSPDSGGSIYGLVNDGSTQYTKWSYLLHSGVTDSMLLGASAGVQIPGVIFGQDPKDPLTYGQSMAQPQAFSSPAVSGDKVFVTLTGSGGNGPNAALACFKANSDFVIRITDTSGYSSGGSGSNSTVDRKPKRLINDSTGREMSVKIWQPNLIAPAGGITVTPLIGAVPVPRDMIDYERGIITFDNFDRLKLRGGTGNVMMTGTFSPSLPVWVFVDNMEIPIDWSTWQPSVDLAKILPGPKQIPQAGNASVDLSGWNNLLWYYIVPPHESGGTRVPCSGIHSSPVVIGNSVYFTCDDGYLYVLPAETGVTSGGQLLESPIWSEKITTSNVAGGGAGQATTSVAGSNGVLLVPAGDGLHAFTNATTLVADGNRLVEVDGAGEATWSIDAITWPVRIPQSADAMPAVTSGPINKPARVRYMGTNELLLVNSGANQVVKIDKSGTVGLSRTRVQVNGAAQPDGYTRWVWDKFTDPGNLLRPGQPTELRGPTDALFWQELEGGRLVYHCLIADSGNHRVLDLVYRVVVDKDGRPQYLDARAPADPSSGYYLPELNWVSVTDSMNERYTYECIQLVPSVSATTPGSQEIWAAVSNYRANLGPGGAPLTQGLGGAIVALAYRAPLEGGGWNYNTPLSGQIVAACDRINWGGVRPLASPRYFQVIDQLSSGPNPTMERHMLVCDNYGVYEVVIGGTAPAPTLIRAVTDEDYMNLPRTIISETDNKPLDACGSIGVRLVANSVQRLPNGNWLICNGYAGADETGNRKFGGEVFEYDWSAAPSESPIKWNAPTLYTGWTSCGDILIPGSSPLKIKPDAWKQKMQKSYVFTQPRSAFRQY